jgi:hypothetical protein
MYCGTRKRSGSRKRQRKRGRKNGKRIKPRR